MNRFFLKLDRFAAWILMAVIIFYAVSGYGMTKGLIDRDIAQSLHLTWLGGIGIVAFVIHTFRGIYLSLLRWKVWNKATQGLLISFYVLLAGFFLYIHFFYVSAYAAAPIATETPATVFTAATLSAYDGRNGQPAYAAVDGIVYDVSAAFRRGDHHGYSAGIDLSDYFYSQHQASLLKRYPIVGTYQP